MRAITRIAFHDSRAWASDWADRVRREQIALERLTDRRKERAR
jgi:hypothetical protein